MPYRAIVLVTLGLLLGSGCGERASVSSTATVDHNATDVMFLQMMIAREAETAQLLRLAAGRALPAEISTWVGAIGTTQADETRTMQGWLTDWRQPIAMDPSADIHAHHGGLDTLAPADLAALEKSGRQDFSIRFLNLLIAQQHNAVELARMETATGTHPGAQSLAHRIEQSRSAQIATLLDLVAEARP